MSHWILLENEDWQRKILKLFLQTFSPPILIDEIQYAPELLPFIKVMVDNKQQDNLFWLTGSQQFQMMKGVTESLAGRVGILEIPGLSNAELEKRIIHHFYLIFIFENRERLLDLKGPLWGEYGGVLIQGYTIILRWTKDYSMNHILTLILNET